MNCIKSTSVSHVFRHVSKHQATCDLQLSDNNGAFRLVSFVREAARAKSLFQELEEGWGEVQPAAVPPPNS